MRSPLLLVESGDFLYKGKPRTPEEMAAARVRSDFILRTYRLMGYDAVLPGEADFAGGESLLRKHIRKGTPFLCLNLVHGGSGKPVFPPWKKISRGGVRFLVTGVIGEDLFPKGMLAGFGWKALNPQEAVSRLLEAREADADLILVLTHLGGNQDLALALGARRPVLLVGGHATSPPLSPVGGSGSMIFRPRDKGMHLAEISIGRNGKSGNGNRTGFVNADRLRGYEEQRRKLADEIGGMDGKRRTIYEKALEGYDGAIRQAEGKRKVRFRAIPLDRTVREDQETAALLSEYRKESNRLARIAENPARTKGDFLGHGSCSSCHARNFSAWRQDPHSRAFETLAKQGDEGNPECIRCHATGYGAGGFLLSSPSRSKGFEGVGCEACHGPGKGHPGKRLTIPGAKACATCHSALGPFPFEQKRLLLGCVRKPAGGAQKPLRP